MGLSGPIVILSIYIISKKYLYSYEYWYYHLILQLIRLCIVLTSILVLIPILMLLRILLITFKSNPKSTLINVPKNLCFHIPMYQYTNILIY